VSDPFDLPLSTVREPVRIDFISDVICPWCYVGFRALVSACARRPDIPTLITMRPFELDPTTPKSGIDNRARLLAKFGGDQAKLDAIRQTLVETGLKVGIEFDFASVKVTPNTRDCHRLLRWARSAGVELECAEAMFQAYHTEGEDLTHNGTLIAIARGLSMDGDLVADLLDSDSDMDTVSAELETARAMGVTGVPCTIFNQQFAVMGAQPVEAFLQALDQAAQQPMAQL
jgi:predicted DsbA family dithiol-disulfide isomerase